MGRNDRKKAVKLTSRPNFDRSTIFDKNLIAVHMKKTEVFFNKPVYVGQAILDLSKTLMFNFHYNYIQKKYKHRAELLFTDTDSLMYQIYTDDFYKDISYDIETKFDTSDYPPNHSSGIPTGVKKKVIGMFKDEVAGKQITYFVGSTRIIFCLFLMFSIVFPNTELFISLKKSFSKLLAAVFRCSVFFLM